MTRTLRHPPLDAPTGRGDAGARPVGGFPDLAEGDELAGRLAEHLVAVALVRKSPEDPVPFAVWWRVTDALRASTLASPEDAVAAVDVALTSLHAAVEGILLTPTDTYRVAPADAGRSVRQAQVLVARLLLGPTATSPTLLHVRLVRLRRALAALPGEE